MIKVDHPDNSQPKISEFEVEVDQECPKSGKASLEYPDCLDT